VKQGLWFLVVSLLLVGAAGLVMALVFPSVTERRAIAISAGVALVVQAAAYGIVRAMAKRNVIAGWGLGAGLRLVALTVFALLVVGRLDLPSAAATVSLAMFLFLTTLVEPLFLKT
jgi:hypothetical protein